MGHGAASSEVFLHVRVLVGVVLGLALTRLLSGISGIVQHPRRRPLYPAHLAWVAVILVMTVHFWWWEFALDRITVWRFELFTFVLGYAFLHYLLASLLFPEWMDDYAGYEDYFLSRRVWFFGLLVAVCAADWIDTWIKGPAYLKALGPEYPIRLTVCAALFLLAAWTSNRRFHIVLPLAFLAYLLSWIGRIYEILG
ncbi:hypothetical protein EDF56_106276 [Novosphingobium sp. PhB165]|uniref:hypothetical protein n=1 Tax=Novosphingobium sp. PhB165 TaxID=2485105 RepID=UPI00104A3C64|nr:hypothetical protein [Novosphingobium sp. PhB165]TCM17160.1 hypothetical protein EDF56_106276 [Novosphingobium sp. PhB165]